MWALGCILAELLGMQAKSVKHYQDRVPLFPGKSCYPLSGDGIEDESGNSKEKEGLRLDQLSVIFDVIGSPTEADIKTLPEDSIQTYLRNLETKDPKDLRNVYPGADPNALSLLKEMLLFNPAQRITVQQSLSHPFFADIRNLKVEVLAQGMHPMSAEVENIGESSENLLENVLTEINFFAEKRKEKLKQMDNSVAGR